VREAALTALLPALTAAPAAGSRKGVIVDPDRSAGTEYALPLKRADREAALETGGRAGGGGRSGQPIFRVGVDQSQGAPENQDRRFPSPGGETRRHGSSNQGGQGDVRREEGSGGTSLSTGNLVPSPYRPATTKAAVSKGLMSCSPLGSPAPCSSQVRAPAAAERQLGMPGHRVHCTEILLAAATT
jgi:hypothetical protein